jgi:hypothetical protein
MGMMAQVSRMFRLAAAQGLILCQAKNFLG